MAFQQLLDALFPPQCGGCETIGQGLCFACVPPATSITVATATLVVTAVGWYEDPLRRAILALKSGRRDVARACGERVAPLAAGAALVPVPTTRARRRERGFDGCALIAAVAAARSGGSVYAHLAQIAGDTQRGRTRDARLAASGRFSWCGPRLDGRTVVLLDDVTTTGATLEDCARCVRAAGGIVREAVCIAAAPRRPPGVAGRVPQ